MDQTSFGIRHMTEKEVELAVDWAAAEGWNPGIHDAQCFWAADRKGFLVGCLDDEPIGCISAVSYGAGYGFVGFYIIRPEWRGRGYGLQLWQAAMDQLTDRVVGLDGVTAQQENYRKSGFELAYRNIRYSGVFPAVPAGMQPELQPGVDIVPAQQVSQAKVGAYDSALFFAPRPGFLSSWLTQKASAVLVAARGDTLDGYGVIRRCRSGWKIGPLFAEDISVADALLRSLAGCANGEEVFLDVPEVNVAAMELAANYNMTQVFDTARMYKGPAPTLPLGKVFGVTTFELG